MKNIYINIREQLKANVPELNWVDLQKGQMNYQRPPILFPAALIRIVLPRTENMNATKQMCDALIVVEVCFDFTGNTDMTTPETAVNESLKYLDTTQKVYKFLQGFKTAEMNALERINQGDEPRPDGYKTPSITFKTSYLDLTAAE